MKSKILFWLLVILVFGILFIIGFLFIESDLRLFFLIEAGALLALILFIFLYHRLIKPYQIILSGVELLNEQDFSTRLRPIGNSEANKLINIFNRMMGQLKDERLRVRERNQFLDLLIQASPQGLIILDFDEKITNINPSGIKLLNINNLPEIIGKKLEDANITLGLSLAKLSPGQDVILRSGGITAYKCTRSSFIDQGFSHPFILIEELTHELLKTEKQTYESIIRTIAHEVNNSMGAMNSTLNIVSDILKEKNETDLDDLLAVVETSSARSLNLSQFISNYAQIIKISTPTLSKTDINEIARSVSNLMNSECEKRNINLVLNLSPQNCIANIDSTQFEQVLINIIKNAYEAIDYNGKITVTTSSHPLSITIENNGPAISDEIAGKIFTPFFTTKPTGQGIGLMLIREILMNHKCRFNFCTLDTGITQFEMFFST